MVTTRDMRPSGGEPFLLLASNAAGGAYAALINTLSPSPSYAVADAVIENGATDGVRNTGGELATSCGLSASAGGAYEEGTVLPREA